MSHREDGLVRQQKSVLWIYFPVVHDNNISGGQFRGSGSPGIVPIQIPRIDDTVAVIATGPKTTAVMGRARIDATSEDGRHASDRRRGIRDNA